MFLATLITLVMGNDEFTLQADSLPAEPPGKPSDKVIAADPFNNLFNNM